IRRPTAGELRFYSKGLDALLAKLSAGTIDEATFQRLRYSLATETTRRILHRTLDEQKAALAGTGANSDCRCASNGDCSAGLVCDPSTMTCVPASMVGSGSGPPDAALCRSLRGTIDDWFNMLNRGVRRTGVGGSDVHGIVGYEAGTPRTL